MHTTPQFLPLAVEPSEKEVLMTPLYIVFCGLAASVVIGLTIARKRISDPPVQNTGNSALRNGVEGSLELSMHPGRAGEVRMLFGGGAPKDGDPEKKPGFMEQMKQAQKMFNPEMMKKYGEIGTKLEALQTELAQTEIECTTSDGGVTVTISGTQVPVGVAITDDLCAKGSDAASAELSTAFKEAHKKSGAYAAQKMKEMYEEIGLPTGPGMVPPAGMQ